MISAWDMLERGGACLTATLTCSGTILEVAFWANLSVNFLRLPVWIRYTGLPYSRSRCQDNLLPLPPTAALHSHKILREAPAPASGIPCHRGQSHVTQSQDSQRKNPAWESLADTGGAT